MQRDRPDDPTLREIARVVGSPPRRVSMLRWKHGRSPPPPWLKPDDLINRLYAHQDRILRDGHARWAVIVHANDHLFRPGKVASGAQVVYAPDDDVSLADLQRIAKRAFALKGTTPSNPDERRVADMLTDEMERALDWPVPPSVTGGPRIITTIVMLPRDHMPDGFLGQTHFPVLADPATSMAVLVPDRYWPAEFRAAWKAETGRVAAHLEAMSVVTVTHAARRQIAAIAAEQGRTSYWLRVGLKREGDGFLYQLDVTEDEPDPKVDVVDRAGDVRVVIAREWVEYLHGTELTYRDDPAGPGFAFNSPVLGRKNREPE